MTRATPVLLVILLASIAHGSRAQEAAASARGNRDTRIHEAQEWLRSDLPGYMSFTAYHGDAQRSAGVEQQVRSVELEVDLDLLDVAAATGSAALARRACVLKINGSTRHFNADGSTASSQGDFFVHLEGYGPGEIPLGGLDPSLVVVRRWSWTRPMDPRSTRWAVYLSGDNGPPLPIDSEAHAQEAAERLREVAELCGV